MLTKNLLILPLLGAVGLLTGCTGDAVVVDGGPGPAVYGPGPGYYDGGPDVIAVRTVEHDRYYEGGGRRYVTSYHHDGDRYRTSGHYRPTAVQARVSNGRGGYSASHRGSGHNGGEAQMHRGNGGAPRPDGGQQRGGGGGGGKKHDHDDHDQH